MPEPSDTLDLSAARRRRRREKVRTLISNEIIVDALCAFIEQHFPQPGGAVLDLGAGSSPYAPLYGARFERSVTLDEGNDLYGHDAADVIAPADDMPFGDGTFDCVICTEVLEHCREPKAVLAEIRRVLVPGGFAFISTPFMKGLHDMPHDYYRYTPSALTYLGDRAGLEVLSVEPRGDWLAVAITMALFPVTKAIDLLPPRLVRYENPLVWLLIAAPQLLYLRYWRATRRLRGTPSGRALNRLAQTPLGYTTVVQRPMRG